ncbi:PP2C family protein-serine/threonine phosphatase [Solidesulfovibrio magneticus]|uniref:Response regulator receiver protein n=1 Tax=Solidesulfovibrio magneticus (strain ATCC 700980 / DSM 13731 / RS-1) TaxID=573370 RepID=C4XPV8_SOLM1|nr:SpoIIE family protein phosphatase [Solidesulfovibrio magneticus]BAH77658.1 response regulator receiver protein [Solidesulfovibrio magneticus RS-1]
MGKVLIVDDERINIHILSAALKNDHSVIIAIDGTTAIDLALSERPDLILLDIMMPGMDGYEACSKLKASPATRDIPIIFITALSDAKSESHGLECGAIDYITKPFNVALVKSRVKNHVELKIARDLLALKQVAIDEALRSAGLIQKSLLPKKLPNFKSVEFSYKFQPCNAIGGDILNVLCLDDSHIGFYLVDVSGHGPSSAMIAVLVYQLMNPFTGILLDNFTIPPRVRSPEEVLNILDKEFPLMRFKKHFTIIYAILNITTGLLTYSNAAHCSPLVLSKDGALKTLDVSGTVIGLAAMPFNQENVTIHPGSKVVFVSDGVEEREDVNKKFYGQERLHKTLQDSCSLPTNELVQGLYDDVNRFAGTQPPSDDLSILALEYKGLN